MRVGFGEGDGPGKAEGTLGGPQKSLAEVVNPIGRSLTRFITSASALSQSFWHLEAAASTARHPATPLQIWLKESARCDASSITVFLDGVLHALTSSHATKPRTEVRQSRSSISLLSSFFFFSLFMYRPCLFAWRGRVSPFRGRCCLCVCVRSLAPSRSRLASGHGHFLVASVF